MKVFLIGILVLIGAAVIAISICVSLIATITGGLAVISTATLALRKDKKAIKNTTNYSQSAEVHKNILEEESL